MAEIVFFLCALLSVSCALALLRGYRVSRSQLLLWSAVCFGFLALSNLILFIDIVLLPGVEFYGSLLRNLSAVAAGSLLLFGLIWEIS